MNCVCNYCCSFDTKEKNYIEYYNIIYILSEIFFVLTLGFYLVIEEEFISRYFILLFFIPSYINFTFTYIRNYLCISFIFNLLYILTKFIFIFYPSSIHDKIMDQYKNDDESVIVYGIILYLLFFIQVNNIILYYFRYFLLSPIIKNENMLFNNGLYYTLKYNTTNHI